MQLALNESNDVPFNIKEKMDPWTELKYYPMIKVEETNVSNHINIKIFLENVNAIDKMVGIPLTFNLSHGYSYFNNMSTLWLLPQSGINNVILQFLNNETFTIINILQAGEYKQLSSLCL